MSDQKVFIGRCHVCEVGEEEVTNCYHCKKNPMCICHTIECIECKQEFCNKCIITKNKIKRIINKCNNHLPFINKKIQNEGLLYYKPHII